MNTEFHPEAEAEFLESVGFYESRVPGLGEALIIEVNAIIQLICQAPQQWKITKNPEIRRAELRQFPFSILYREKNQQIQILALAHHRRRPGYWLNRRNEDQMIQDSAAGRYKIDSAY